MKNTTPLLDSLNNNYGNFYPILFNDGSITREQTLRILALILYFFLLVFGITNEVAVV